jgi:hypothetical protein
MNHLHIPSVEAEKSDVLFYYFTGWFLKALNLICGLKEECNFERFISWAYISGVHSGDEISKYSLSLKDEIQK